MARLWSGGLRRGEGRRFGRVVALVAAVGMAVAIAGCGGSSGGGSGGGSNGATSLPGSTIAIVKNLAWVPNGINGSGNGVIDIINLNADPNTTNPLKKTITLTQPGYPTATSYDGLLNKVVIVTNNGYVYLFNASTFKMAKGSPVQYPSGSQGGYYGSIGLSSGKLYGAPNRDFAILSMCDTGTCSSGNSATGFALFDLKANAFQGNAPANYPEFTSTEYQTALTVDASDDDAAGQIGIFEGVQGNACVLSDSNLPGDNDSAVIDPTTHIVVVSNEDGTATVLNLNGGTFSSGGPPCTFTEAGTTPNSTVVSGLGSSSYLEGGAINTTTHQALLTGDGTADMALLSLPSAPVTQLTASDVSAQTTTMPDDPAANSWGPLAGPYLEAINPKTNKAYVVSYDGFLAQIDLAQFASDPASISAALPTTSNCGSSYGITGTTAACSNTGNAVVFFPLPAP